MRWQKQNNEEHQTRVRTKFLFLPKLIGNEYRWLERASWLQHQLWSAYTGWYWVDDEWI